MFLSHFVFDLIVLILGVGLLFWSKGGEGLANKIATLFAFVIIILAAIAMVYHLFH